MTFRDLEKILKQDGWKLQATKGSHHQYEHPSKLGKVTIPRHGGDIKTGTLKSILRQAGLK